MVGIFLNHFFNVSVTISIESDVLFLDSLNPREWGNVKFEFRIHFFDFGCINIDFDEEHVNYIQHD